MKLKISERLTQPEVGHYIDWLGSVGYRNVNCSMTYDGHSYQLMDELFALLKKLKPISKNGARSLWICAKRGTINDFAKRYGDFDELMEDETVKTNLFSALIDGSRKIFLMMWVMWSTAQSGKSLQQSLKMQKLCVSLSGTTMRHLTIELWLWRLKILTII